MNDNEFIKALNGLEHIQMMKPLIRAVDWDGLERQSEMRCREHAGHADTRRISRIRLQAYQETLTSGLSVTITKAKSSGAKAIYFEFDMDYDWRSCFFICPQYPRQWLRLLRSDFLEEVNGPEMPRLFKIYCELDLGTPRDVTMESYLIARTFACFGRASQQFADSGITVGMAFHDRFLQPRTPVGRWCRVSGRRRKEPSH